MAVNPAENVNKRNLPAFPYDSANHRPAVLMGAIIDSATHEVIGYLPVRCKDNLDGTCTPYVDITG